MVTEKTLKTWDENVRQGQGQTVREQLESLSADRSLEKHYPKIINLCRRTGAYATGFSIGNRFFHDHSTNVQAYPEFYLEYAALLSEVGAFEIAGKIFSQFVEGSYRWQGFYLALHKMKIWDFHAAEKYLVHFLNEEDDEYWHKVAELNLIFCQIFNRKIESAQENLERLQLLDNKKLILGTIQEQMGEVHFLQGQYEKSKTCLNNATNLLQGTANPIFLFARKWQLILQLKETGKLPSDWEAFSLQCRKQGYWEVLRDMDFYRSHVTEDELLLNRVYFGTPHEQYRKRLLLETEWTPSNEWLYGTPPNDWIWSRQKAELFFRDQKIPLPDLFRRLLQCLSDDLYRQNATGYIFDALYPADHFHPEFARQRIYSLISRFRKYCSENEIPFEVESHHLGFQITRASIEYFNVQKPILWDLSFDEKIEKLMSHFGNKEFSANEAAEFLQTSKRTLNRLLTLAVDTGSLIRTGKSRNIRYCHPTQFDPSN